MDPLGCLLMLLLLPIILLVGYIGFLCSLKGDVKAEEERLLQARLSDDEQLLACIPVSREVRVVQNAFSAAARGVVGLTYRRVIVLTLDPKLRIRDETVIEIRHITDRAFAADAVRLTTRSGDKYCLACDKRKERFCAALEELLDRQSRTSGLTGAADELTGLAELVARGILTQQDFDRAKGLLLGKPISRVEESVQLLESLYALRKQGVLSESEFNIKKWDILSK